MLRVTKELFGVLVKILELVKQVTLSKVIKVTQQKHGGPYPTSSRIGLLEEVKKFSMAEYPYLVDHQCLNLEDEIYLKRGRIVTP